MAWAMMMAAAATGDLASLDLCADEYLLMLAPRTRIASISYLGASEEDNALAKRARGLPTNRGSLESLLESGAKTLLTTRPLGRLDSALAARLGMEVVTLQGGGPDAVASSVAKVARLAGNRPAAARWRNRLHELQASAPTVRIPALWIAPGGVGANPDGALADWLGLAGLAPVAARPGLSRVEQVVASTAPIVIRSHYRDDQYARSADFLEHPLVAKAGKLRLDVDGRRFVCGGPLMLGEIARLQKEMAR